MMRLAVAVVLLCAPAASRAEVDAGVAFDAQPAPSDLGVDAASSDAGTATDLGPPTDAAPAPPTAPPAADVDRGPPVLSARFTGVWGRIVDDKTGEPIIEAQVKVVSPPGIKKTALSNLDGWFKLKLPPGRYDLRVFYELYQGRRLVDVVIEPGTQQRIDVRLAADQKVVQEIVVQAKEDRRKSTVLLQERRKATTVRDALSAQEIARSPDSSANDAVKRIPSATVRDGRYVVIRGLGGRYSSTLLNGTYLPSPEPDEPAIPLDLFPTSLLANLTVQKSYGLEMPGNFAGGVMEIETNSYPSTFELKLQVRLEANSEATLRRMPTYTGGKSDFLGYDDGARALPRQVPSNAAVYDPPLNEAARGAIGARFNDTWDTRSRLGVPNLSLNGTVGGTRALRGGRKLGYLVGLSYSHRDEVREGEFGRGQLDGTRVVARETGRQRTGRELSQLGALANIGLHAGDHDVNLFTLYAHSGEKEAIEQSGFAQLDNTDFVARRLRFVQRDLSYTQLRGQHRFARAHGFELNWQGNAGVVLRNEPDTRDTYRLHVDEEYIFRNQAGNGERLFSTLRETSGGVGFDAHVPWKRFSLRFGGAVQMWSRRFDARRFRALVNDLTLVAQPANQLLQSGNYTSGAIDFREQTNQYDGYDAFQLIGGGYLSGELRLRQVRVIAGLRYEAAVQTLTPGSRYSIVTDKPIGTDRTDSNPIPAANVIWAINERMNLRAAYSYTVARPRLRELAPFAYFDFERRRSIAGNPRLETTTIHNADLRWEWFLRSGGVVAVSAFYKRFERPIEQVIISASDGAVSWENGTAADLVGAELEARSDFGFISRKVKALYAAANVSGIWSRTTIPMDKLGPTTSSTRALQGQSPYVVNLTFGYSSEKRGTEAALLYNVFGARILEVGLQGLPDVFEQPIHRLDLAVSQRVHKQVRLKLAATNLAYQRFEVRQADLIVQSFQPGISASLAVEWTPY